MALTWSEVESANLPAENNTRAFHDEYGVDWEHWHYRPDRPGYATDGHSHSAAAHPAWPRDGWVHAKGCTCPWSPLCTDGVHEHDAARRIYDHDDEVFPDTEEGDR